MIAEHTRVVVDLGTGSGQAVLRRARQYPSDLVIGIDADAAAMAESSRRAAAPTTRDGVANALFLIAPAESLPGPLAGQADLMTIALPWGSLLRALLEGDESLLSSIKATLKRNGYIEMLLSATGRDAHATRVLAADADASRLGRALESRGFSIVECRPACASDVDRLSSGWGRRLGIPHRRPAWLFRLRRA